jgi:hypothetical protein
MIAHEQVRMATRLVAKEIGLRRPRMSFGVDRPRTICERLFDFRRAELSWRHAERFECFLQRALDLRSV